VAGTGAGGRRIERCSTHDVRKALGRVRATRGEQGENIESTRQEVELFDGKLFGNARAVPRRSIALSLQSIAPKPNPGDGVRKVNATPVEG
jgi:hypothetical protein